MKNYYEILEISSKASAEVIEKSYKVLAKKYHPDLQNGTNRYLAEETLKDINEAYSVLSDAHLRQAYDREYEKMYGIKNAEDNYQNIYRDARKREYSYDEDYEQTKAESKKAQYSTSESANNSGLIGIIKNIVSSFTNLKNIDFRKKHANEFSQKILAIFLTILIMGSIIFILWNIPFTRNWITGV